MTTCDRTGYAPESGLSPATRAAARMQVADFALSVAIAGSASSSLVPTNFSPSGYAPGVVGSRYVLNGAN